LVNKEKDKLAYLSSIKDEFLQKRAEYKYDLDKNIKELEDYKKSGDFTFVILYENFIKRLNLKILEIDEIIVKIDIEIDKQRRILLKTHNDKKIIENLKNNHFVKYKDFVKKEENKFIDEVTMIKYIRGEDV
jgi:flagellar export protein FliJ